VESKYKGLMKAGFTTGRCSQPTCVQTSKEDLVTEPDAIVLARRKISHEIGSETLRKREEEGTRPVVNPYEVRGTFINRDGGRRGGGGKR